MKNLSGYAYGISAFQKYVPASREGKTVVANSVLEALESNIINTELQNYRKNGTKYK